jgi:hypothetical protein
MWTELEIRIKAMQFALDYKEHLSDYLALMALAEKIYQFLVKQV